jgi:hypothetical protein
MSRPFARTTTTFLLVVGLSAPAWPYGIETHRAINEGAIFRSSLSDYLTEVLGLKEGIAATFNQRDVQGWIREGGAFEDQPVTRTANHFHYPLRRWDEALLTDLPGSLRATQSSVLWAQNPDQQRPEGTWSWVRARREFFDALTVTDAAEREMAFGNAFRALGQVLHLIADGSVPAHARNDSHVFPEPLESWLNAEVRPRGVETPEEARARFLATFTPNSVGFSPAIFGVTPNPLATIPITKAFDADAYDGTAASLGLTTGDTVGITEFSNANFFSADTVFADTFIGLERFSPFPSHTGVEQFIDPVNNRRYWRKTDPGISVEHLATVSRLDFFRSGRPPLTGGLDPVVHEEYGRLLIPRAVGYSAGLIDYFFRGRLAAVDPEFTETGVALKVTNAIDPEQSPAWANEKLFSHDNQLKPGRLVLTVTYKRGEKELFAASDPVTLEKAETLDPGQTSTQILSFDMPALPDDATDVEYRLVFRGRLGQEDDAVAVGIVEPASGFIVTPDYVPNDGITGRRLIVRSGGKWRVTEDRNLQGGNIDWKGWYENGRPTKVLSWSGPKARHFPDSSGDPFTVYVYQDGKRFAFAPDRVLGAAIAKDGEGMEWLIVICKYGNADGVFRRPNKLSNSPAFFDPVTNPDGWQLIGRFPWEADFKQPNRPWFFNGDGTEAQTLREVQLGTTETGLKTTRLKINVSNPEQASIVNLGNLEGVKGGGTNAQRMIKGDRSCDWLRETSGEASGRYIVAVDYRGDKELLCELARQAENSTSTRMAFTGQASANLVNTYKVSDRRLNSELLSCGTLEVELNRHTQNGLTDITRTASGVSGSTEQSSEGERQLIGYLDIRDNLIVTSSSGSQYEASLTPIGTPTFDTSGLGQGFYQGLGVINSTSVERDLIKHGQVAITAFDFMKTFTGDTGQIGFDVIAGNCVNSESSHTSGSTNYPVITVDPKTQGSWAIDSNGNLAVSQTKGANHLQGGSGSQFGTGEFFNFVTGGDFETAIPGAPENAHYFPMSAVK